MMSIDKLSASGIAVLALVAITLLPVGLVRASESDTTILTLTHQVPAHSMSGQMLAIFEKRVAEISQGAIQFSTFPSAQIVKGHATYQAVEKGLIDIGLVGLIYVGHKLPMSSVIELPGMFVSQEVGHRAIWKLIEEDLQEAEFRQLGLRSVLVFMTGSLELLLRDGRIEDSVANVLGRKIRTQGNGGDLAVSALGMVPVRVSHGDAYLSLSRGVIDGALQNLPGVQQLRLNEVTQTASRGAALGNAVFIAFINDAAWSRLSVIQQQRLIQAGKSAGQEIARLMDYKTREANDLLESVGMNTYEIAAPVQAQLNEVFREVEQRWLSQMQRRDIDGQHVLQRFRKNISEAQAQIAQ